MKQILYIILLLLLPLTLSAQSTDQNYILTRTYQTADSTKYLDQIQYFDGLGRSVHTVQKGITPTGKDLVNLIEYDDVGQEYKHWIIALARVNAKTYVSSSDFVRKANQVKHIRM